MKASFDHSGREPGRIDQNVGTAVLEAPAVFAWRVSAGVGELRYFAPERAPTLAAVTSWWSRLPARRRAGDGRQRSGLRARQAEPDGSQLPEQPVGVE